MVRTLLGIPPSAADLREDLSWFLDMIRDCHDVEVMFGFAWGNFRYPAQWQWERLTVSTIPSEIAAQEAHGDGRFGSDDLYLRVNSLGCERLYCHHTDVHFTTDDTAELFQRQQQRWRELGWETRDAEPA